MGSTSKKLGRKREIGTFCRLPSIQRIEFLLCDICGEMRTVSKRENLDNIFTTCFSHVSHLKKFEIDQRNKTITLDKKHVLISYSVGTKE